MEVDQVQLVYLVQVVVESQQMLDLVEMEH